MGYGNSSNAPKFSSNRGTTTAAAGGKFEDTAVLRKLIRPSKTGKSLGSFTTGDVDLILPANHSVVITALSEVRQKKLAEVGKAKGFKGAVPTHELAVYPITEQK